MKRIWMKLENHYQNMDQGKTSIHGSTFCLIYFMFPSLPTQTSAEAFSKDDVLRRMEEDRERVSIYIFIVRK